VTSAEYPAGWTCAQVTVRFERYLLGTLPLAEALALADHIEACVWCGQALVLLRLDRPRDIARG
jgi:hypothetical protein